MKTRSAAKTRVARDERTLPQSRMSRNATKRVATERDEDEDEVRSVFHIDPKLVPKGVRYEWKRETILGKHDAESISMTLRSGWTPVPASRHPSLVAPPLPGQNKDTLIRAGGMILCEKAEAKVRRAEERIRRETDDVTRAKEAELGESKDPTNFPRLKPTLTQDVTPGNRFDEDDEG